MTTYRSSAGLHIVALGTELPNELELLDACIDRYMAGKETEE